MTKKYNILLTSSIILFSSYYCYDIPAALNRSLTKSNSIFNTFNITMLYSSYAFPNIFVPILLTIFFKDILKSGFKIILSLMVLLGHAIFTFGLKINHIKVMIIGRFLFGLGNETLFVVLSNQITENFKRNISLSLCVFISIGRLGIVSTFILTPLIAEKISPFISSLAGVSLLLASVLINAILNGKQTKRNKKTQITSHLDEIIVTLDKKISQKKPFIENQDLKDLNTNSMNQNNVCEDSLNQNSMESDFVDEHIEYLDNSRNKKITISPNVPTLALAPPSTENVWKINDNNFNGLNETVELSDSSIELNSLDDTKIQSPIKIPEMPFNDDSDSLRINDFPISISQNNLRIRTIHTSFFLLTLIAFFLSFVWAPFYNLGPMVLQSKYKISQISSSHLMAFIEGTQMIFFIFSGFIADLIGKKFIMITFGCFLLTISYFVFFFKGSLFIMISIMSLAAPLHSLYWSLVSNLCGVNYIPIAFAILSCQLNLSFTIAPIIYSYLIKKHQNYDIMAYLSLTICIITCFLCIVLNIWNKRANLSLNKSFK